MRVLGPLNAMNWPYHTQLTMNKNKHQKKRDFAEALHRAARAYLMTIRPHDLKEMNIQTFEHSNLSIGAAFLVSLKDRLSLFSSSLYVSLSLNLD